MYLQNIKMIDNMEKIKLVIWDLDNTFWTGILSEEPISKKEETIGIVKKLVDRGIMNSISSKNDFFKAKKELEKLGVWDYFIFPHIDWKPKGVRVKNIIETSQLRAENVLFLDDDHINRNEIKYHNPDIHVRDINFIPKILEHQAFKGKDDSKHSRLKQYKLLEKRSKVKEKFDDNTQFLIDSDIQIVYEDPKKNLDRLYEISERTNQLNFTKKRLKKDEILKYLKDDSFDVSCFRVIDKYGDYGIAGYYILGKNNKNLIEFAFSCRILNLGVPSYVYKKLNHPKLNIKGDVSESIDLDVNWIRETRQDKVKQSNKYKNKVLFIGGCDLEQVYYYLSKNNFVDREFNFLNKGVHVYRENITHLLEQDKKDLFKKYGLFGKIPFLHPKLFESKLCEDYDYIIYSVITNYEQERFYFKKDNSLRIAYGHFEEPLMNIDPKKNRYNLKETYLRWFRENFISDGMLKPDDFEKEMRELLRLNKKAKWIIINGSKISKNEPIKEEQYKKLNNVLYKLHKERLFDLIDVNKFIKNKEDLTDVLRHYKRYVYFKIANEILDRINRKDVGLRKYSFLLNKYSIILYGFLKRKMGSILL